jgi:glucokinase
MESGEKVSGVKEIAEKAKKYDIAKSVFHEFGSNLGNFLGPWLKKFEAEKLIIGGNVSGAYNLFGNKLEASLKNQGLEIATEISLLMENAAMAGSAYMFEDHYWEKIRPLLSKM